MKNAKKLTALILMVIMFVQLISFNAVSVIAAGASDGFSSEITGIPEDAIHIKTAADLTSIGGARSEGKYYILDNDINLTSKWAPIIDFRGTLDGQGYSINNLHIVKTSRRQYAGLFGQIVADNVIIKNLGINIGEDGLTAYHDDDTYAGALVGRCDGKITIENCYVTGKISASSNKSFSIAGGFIGYFGGNGAIAIERCYNKGDVDASAKKDSYAGGLLGYCEINAALTIKKSYTSGNITVSAFGSAAAGGLVGLCYANEGKSSALIENCYTSGSVEAAQVDSWAGGLIGYFGGNSTLTVKNCYSLSRVIATGSDTYAGGLIGQRHRGSQTSVIQSYRLYTQRIKGNTINESGVPMTTKDMKDKNNVKENFKNWDFSKVWGYTSDINDDYPVLRDFYVATVVAEVAPAVQSVNPVAPIPALIGGHTISFDLNIDSVPLLSDDVPKNQPPNQSIADGGYIKEPSPEPLLEGYKFRGWYTEADNEDEDEFDFETSIIDSMILYAKWEKDISSYIIEFGVVNNVGGIISATATETENGETNFITIKSGDTVDKNENVVFFATPNSGWKIKGWTSNLSAVNGTSSIYTINNIKQPYIVMVEFQKIPETNAVVPTTVAPSISALIVSETTTVPSTEPMIVAETTTEFPIVTYIPLIPEPTTAKENLIVPMPKVYIDKNGTEYIDPDSIDTRKSSCTIKVSDFEIRNNSAYVAIPAVVLADFHYKNSKFIIGVTTSYGSYQVPVNLASIIPDLNDMLVKNKATLNDITFKITLSNKSNAATVNDLFKNDMPNGEILGSIVDFTVEIARLHGNKTGEVIGRADNFTERIAKLLPMPQTLQATPAYWNAFRFNEATSRIEFAPHTTQVIDGIMYVVIMSAVNSTYVTAENSVMFNDVSASQWYSGYIEKASAKRLVQGIGNGLYAPERAVTRAEFVQMIVNALQLPKAQSNIKTYSDISIDWYYDAVMRATSAGLLSRFTGDTFSPNQAITREEMAVILAAAIRREKLSMTVKNTDLTSAFSDYNKFTQEYIPDIDLVYQAGLMQGKGANMFDPKGTVIRAEAATVQIRLLEVLKFID